MASLILIVAMFALLWLLLIRPQRMKQAQQQRMIDTVEPGDEVLTVGGIYGIVEEIDEEDDLVVEIAEGIQVRVARRAVASVVKPDDEEDEETGEAGEASAEPHEPEQPLDEVDEEDGVNDRDDAVRGEPAADPTAAPRS
jgi:preprotein translocase subunit YajC